MSEETLGSKLDNPEDKVIDALGQKIMSEWNDAKFARQEQEKVFIRAHRNNKGVYPPTMTFSGESRAKVNITRPRVSHIASRLMEVANPIGELPFTIEPTPLPDMPILKAQLEQAGLPPEDVLKQIEIEANKNADILTDLYADTLVETNWSSVLSDIVENSCLFGTGIAYGPMAVPAKSDKLKALRGLVEGDDAVRAQMSSISPLRFYPAPGATDIEDCPYAFVYNTIDKTTLRDFKKQPELFDIEAIDDLLKNAPNGNWQAEQWENEILYCNNNTETGPSGRFALLIRWGFLSGRDLRESGVDDISDDDLDTQIMTQVWVSCGRVISIRLTNLFRDRLPFYVFPYSRVSESLWGCGVAEAIFDSQDAIDACERAMFDNMAYSCAGPLTEVNVNRLADKKDVLNIGPRAVIRTIDSEYKGEGAGRAVNFQIIPSNTAELLNAKSQILQLVQEQTGIPNVLMGQGGAGIHDRTSSGAYLQFNNAITPIKGLIMRLENSVIVPMLHKMKEFFDTMPGYKKIQGDFKINPSGVSGLVAREVATNKFNMIMTNAAQFPQLAEGIDLGRVVEGIMRGTGLLHEKITYTPAEIAQKRQEEAMAKAQAAAMETEAVGMAQANVENKQRAETSKVDTLLQAMDALADKGNNSPLKLELIRHALIAKGMMTDELDQAIENEMEYSNVLRSDEVNALGVERATREAVNPGELK